MIWYTYLYNKGLHMKIDYLSDLHLDFYFNPTIAISTKNVKLFFDDIFGTSSSNILIIAGDIGHYNLQNIEVLKILHKEYYKNIICVLGNHDYYLLNSDSKKEYKNNSYNRVEQMRTLINKEDGLHCLNGDIIEIDGVKFAGCDSWYSDAYMKYYYPKRNEKFILKLWKHSLNDYQNTQNIENFLDLYNDEMRKLEKIYKKCDVMITHINPSYLEEHIVKRYHGSDINTFFTFDGHKYLKNGTMKYWVFGHTHDVVKYDFEGVQCVCNPFGYPSESNYGEYIEVESIEV